MAEGTSYKQHSESEDESRSDKSDDEISSSSIETESDTDSSHSSSMRSQRQPSIPNSDPACEECSEVCDDYIDHGNVAALHIDAKVMCASKTDKTGQRQSRVYIKEILKHVCAFRNSGGGLLLIHVQNHANNNWYKGWLDQRLDRHLNDLIEDGSLFGHIFKKSWEPVTNQTSHRGFLAIRAVRSMMISTVQYNTYFQTDHEVTPMKSSNIIKFFKNKRIFASDQPKLRGSPAENIYESREVQFKHLESKTTISPKYLKKKLWSVDHIHISTYISAFSKNDKGGTFYFGVRENVTENLAVIEKSGFNFQKENQTPSQEENELSNFKSNLEKKLNTSLRVFNYEGESISQDIVKVALHDADIAGNKVLEVAVAPVSGIVFTKKPESYFWKKEALDFGEINWIKHMEKNANQ